jgi:hypothetical protein
MTDARLLQNPELLLKWSASLDYRRLSFDEWIHQTEGDPDEFSGSSCADAAGHSVRVSDRLVPSSR